MNRWKENLGPEGRLLVDVIGNLRRLGWLVWSMEQNRRSRVTAGVADVLALQDDLLVAIELKAGSNKATRHQLTYLRAFRRSGNHALVAWSWGEVAWGLHYAVGASIPEEAVPGRGEVSKRFLDHMAHLYEDLEVAVG